MLPDIQVECGSADQGEWGVRLTGGHWEGDECHVLAQARHGTLLRLLIAENSFRGPTSWHFLRQNVALFGPFLVSYL